MSGLIQEQINAKKGELEQLAKIRETAVANFVQWQRSLRECDAKINEVQNKLDELVKLEEERVRREVEERKKQEEEKKRRDEEERRRQEAQKFAQPIQSRTRTYQKLADAIRSLEVPEHIKQQHLAWVDNTDDNDNGTREYIDNGTKYILRNTRTYKIFFHECFVDLTIIKSHA